MRAFRFDHFVTSLAVSLSLVGIAAAGSVADNFNNDVINGSLWNKEKVGGVNVKETNHQLQINGSGSTGEFSYAFLEADHWGIDWTENFTISLEYKLQLPSPGDDRVVAAGVALSLDNIPNDFSNFDGFIVGVQRDSGGLWLVWYEYNSGDVIDSGEKAITDTHDTLTITWMKSQDRLKIKAAGKVLNVYGIYATYGDDSGHAEDLHVAIGGFAQFGDIAFPGTKAWLDNFNATGHIMNN